MGRSKLETDHVVKDGVWVTLTHTLALLRRCAELSWSWRIPVSGRSTAPHLMPFIKNFRLASCLAGFCSPRLSQIELQGRGPLPPKFLGISKHCLVAFQGLLHKIWPAQQKQMETCCCTNKYPDLFTSIFFWWDEPAPFGFPKTSLTPFPGSSHMCGFHVVTPELWEK